MPETPIPAPATPQAQTPATVDKPIVGVVVPNKGFRFAPGHPRYGGRKKGSVSKQTQLAREIAAAMNFDPVRLTVEVITMGLLRTVQPDGIETFEPVPVEERMKMLRDLQQYLQPKLSAMQVTGKDEGPINVQTMDMTQILSDPDMARKAASLAMALGQAKQNAQIAQADDIPAEDD